MKQTLKKAKRLLKSVYNALKWRFDICFRRDMLLSKTAWGGVTSLGEEIAVNCSKYLSKEELNNKVVLRKIENDIIKCYYKYEASPLEYFTFGFRESNSKRRGEFLTAIHKDRMMLKKVGKGDMFYLLKDKSRFYERFKEFFNRDACAIRTEADRDAFLQFSKKHPKFIAKKIKGSHGHGTELIELERITDSAEDVFTRLLSLGEYFCEELIIQHEALASFNPSSVNTLRVPTFMNKDGFHILKPYIRIGRPGTFTDHSTNGGVIAVIDEKTGVIISEGVDLMGGKHEFHPDSGVRIKDFQIPLWDEFLIKVEHIHNSIKDYPYIGWDFALSENGWVLVEGNWGCLFSEAIDKEGIKKKFDNMFD